ncbi:unnamed protein product [Cochlearia groenlandica]
MSRKIQISPRTVFKAINSKMKIMTTVIITCLLILSVKLLSSSSNNFNNQLLDAIINDTKESGTPVDKLIGGLLTADFDERSCVSRYYKSLLYRKPSPYTPSEYLISKLRSYETLHRRCGPGTEAYKESTKNLGYHSESVGECKYIVWVASFGLGNRMISVVSTFLYALLTDRIILVDNRKGISDLFCEPFPDTSWLLPSDFPRMDRMYTFNSGHSRCYGTMVKNHGINSTTIPRHLYLYLSGDYSDQDQQFFCEEDQIVIKKVPWLVVQANLYFAPSLWLIPSFQGELAKLFPRKETVFRHLSMYLFHPTNQVWGMVIRYYNTYLSRAEEILGIQIRVFDTNSGYLQHVMDQILTCTQREKLLPEIATQVNHTSSSKKLKAVLVTSLRPEYSDHLEKMYKEKPTSTGEKIEVYQPSGEKYQQTDKGNHDQKALAEIYLLSLSDKIVTSAWSTFGYVAHSLGGLRPWLLYMPNNNKSPDPPCVRSVSMDPCFHKPPFSGCQAKTIENESFVMRCEDCDWGMKLLDPTK